MPKHDKVIKFGPYKLGREYLKDVTERAKRIEQAERGERPGSRQLSIPWVKGR